MAKQDNLSDDYKRVEQEREHAIEEKRIEKENEKLVYYFHVAKKGQLDHWRQEERYANGALKSRDEPLRFDEHVYIARTPQEIDFIEKHDSFNIHCFRCDSADDAYRRAQEAEIAKNKRSVSVDLNIRADGIDVLTAE